MVHAGVKLVIGLLILFAGIYWYAADFLRLPGFSVLGTEAWMALKTVFIGVFGLFLIFVGAIVAWIEYEDLKWERREKSEKKRK
ncbi:MAG: hypothetical protein HYU56_00075 [Candidatus Aenigmarchaeota archaeon]|nr:hypothetical protein [Candidatus Aenigmarchaeota archaeon]